MIDIHCHILPAIDDGPSDLQKTLEMLRIAAGDGITHIVATPHYRHGEPPTVQDIRGKIALVQTEMAKNNITVKLMEGADIRLTYELMEGIEKNEIPTINNSSYFLLELPDLIPPHVNDFLFEARVRGFVPVITHPERNHSLISFPEKIKALKDAGALIQLTAMSVTGNFGRQIKKFAGQLLKKGYVDFIATDAHSTRQRPPLLSKAYMETVAVLDKVRGDRIFFDNPEALVENREIEI